MNKPKPRITGTTHTLPFDKLSPREFERLCLWLVEREGYERAEHLGAAGSEQGRDIIAWRGGRPWAFQCKRVRSFGPRDAEAEVDKVLGLSEDLRPAALVFLVACDVSDETRRRARARCAGEMDCHFWALTELDEKVNRHPDLLDKFFYPIPRSRQEKRAEHNRRAMLKLVKDFWVKGVLEQSLHGAAMIEIGLEERADAVERPWDAVLQIPGQPNRPLPRSTKIMDVFDDTSQAILILGEPGSGKTTMLLELARDTIARAEEDLTQPIPVVLNLSSWAVKRQPIAEWLVEELNTKYYIPKKPARPWVECDELLLLLDGLDEVAVEWREDCVKAINEFRQEHLVPLVVCSRVADYEALTARLRLQGAVLLQPLTPQQIDDYLGRAGAALSAVRRTLKHDPTLQELAETPLMLSIMTLAYQGAAVEDLQALDTVDARRKHLFDEYVRQMFERRGADQPHSPRQTTHWLAWLAQQMSEHGQSMFLIERMQPSWLQTVGLRWLYALIYGLTAGQIYVLMSGLLGMLCFGGDPLIWLLIGLLGELVLGLYTVYVGIGRKDMKTDIETEKTSRWPSWAAAKSKLRDEWRVVLKGGRIVGLIGVALGMLIGVLAGVPGRDLIQGLLDGLLGGLLGGLVFGLIGLNAGLLGVLVRGLIDGMRGGQIGASTKSNQGIWQSGKNALLFGLLGGLFGGVLSGLRFGLQVSEENLQVDLFVVLLGLAFALLGGLTFLLGGGMKFGGDAFIKHFILRLLLWHSGRMPSNYARFLDYAAERIFLRKVGGGYIFIHRLLQDHFASL